MSSNSTNESIVITVPPPEDNTLATIREVQRLRLERAHIEEKLHRLLTSLSGGDTRKLRPTWGPCTRCGHVWRGHWVNLPPRGCPRCGSSGWRVEPTRPDARRPDDPPNPRWGKNRITGLPTDPENVLGRKTHAARIARAQLRRKHQAEQAAAAAHERRLALESATPEERSARLTPPPKLEEIAAAVEVRPMVAPPNIRFAESTAAPPIREGASQPDNLEEPNDGVPIRINEDGTITELEPGDSTEDELVEAINDSGSVVDNEEEEAPNGNDS